MATCVTVDQAGVIVYLDPQPAEFAACQMVLQSGAEMLDSPFSLSAEQGSQIGGAILAVWGIAFGFRAVARTLSTAESKEE